MLFIKLNDIVSGGDIIINLNQVIWIRKALGNSGEEYSVVKLKDKTLLKVKEKITFFDSIILRS